MEHDGSASVGDAEVEEDVEVKADEDGNDNTKVKAYEEVEADEDEDNDVERACSYPLAWTPGLGAGSHGAQVDAAMPALAACATILVATLTVFLAVNASWLGLGAGSRGDERIKRVTESGGE
jgi:hypothetical protein